MENLQQPFVKQDPLLFLTLSDVELMEIYGGGFWKDVGRAMHDLFCPQHGFYRDHLEAHPGGIAL